MVKSMNFRILAMHPDPIINYILHQYDELETEIQKAKYLKDNNKPFNEPVAVEKLKGFSRGKIFALNAGEVLGLGVIAEYYNWLGEETGNTYQIVVGVEDKVKQKHEKLLSDGAIWHDEREVKMLYQTTMAQGYVPERTITATEINERINDKASRRADYEDNCGLIVNVFAKATDLDFNEIYIGAKNSGFTEVYMIIYDIPQLRECKVYRMSHTGSPMLTLRLKRHPLNSEWQVNDIG